jgi:hypothetical protein
MRYAAPASFAETTDYGPHHMIAGSTKRVDWKPARKSDTFTILMPGTLPMHSRSTSPETTGTSRDAHSRMRLSVWSVSTAAGSVGAFH